MEMVSARWVVRTGLFSLLAFAMLVTACPARTRACGNVPMLERSERAKLLADAEDRLMRGMPGLTVAWGNRALVYLGYVYPGDEPMERRARRLIAIGTVRLEGRDRGGRRRQLQAVTASGVPRAKIQEAAKELARQAAEAPSDAALQTSLGEAYALLPGRRAAALRILSTLEAADRIVAPEGYAALARMRRERVRHMRSWWAGPVRSVHVALAASARARCLQMASKPRVCQVEGV